jgi:hypothetical protein
MSFLKKLFGGSGKASAPAKPVEEVEYKGFQIATTPIDEGGQFRVCALISKEVDGETKTHKLIRADMCASAEEASTIAVRKAQQMIDEQGTRILS